jgi:hypothetical protein
MRVGLEAVLGGWSGKWVRWTALVGGWPVVPVRGMGDALYALHSRNPGVAWAQQAEARGCREAWEC